MNGWAAHRGILVLAAMICHTASLAAATWSDEFNAGTFVFRSEFPLDNVQDLLDDIAELQTELEELLGLTCNDKEIQVHLFRNRASYQRYLAVRVPQGTKRQAFYMPGTDAGRVYAYKHRGLDTDVRHETTHALLRNALPYIPLWLDEGLAEYFEVSRGQRDQGDGHLTELRFAIRFGWRPDLKRLEGKRGFLEMGARDYRDAWGIIHYLIHGSPEARQIFLAYLEAIQSGGVPDPLSDSLRAAIPNYEQEIVRHLKGP